MAITSFTAVKANLGASYRNYNEDAYIFTRMRGQAISNLFYTASGTVIGVGSATPGVAAGDVNTVTIDGQNFQYYVTGAYAATAPQARSTPLGLVIFVDAVDNDGFEFAPTLVEAITPSATGIPTDGTIQAPTRLVAAGGDVYTSRTDNCFVRVKLAIQDVSAQDFVCVGFRKAEVPVDALTTYTDYFVLNINNGTAEIRNRLNTGTESVSISTETVADAGTVTLEVRVDTSGVARAIINNAAVAVDVTGFKFDSGDLLMPFLKVQNDSTDGGSVAIQEWEQGPWDQRGLASLGDITN